MHIWCLIKVNQKSKGKFAVCSTAHINIILQITMIKHKLKWLYMVTGQQGKEEAISLTPLYYFYPLYRRLDISQVFAAESSPLHIAGIWAQTRNLWFPIGSR